MEITLKEHCARIAKLGGAARSEKKAQAARLNARKPRPNARKRNALLRAQKKSEKRLAKRGWLNRFTVVSQTYEHIALLFPSFPGPTRPTKHPQEHLLETSRHPAASRS
jgi:hypothetical protein